MVCRMIYKLPFTRTSVAESGFSHRQGLPTWVSVSTSYAYPICLADLRKQSARTVRVPSGSAKTKVCFGCLTEEKSNRSHGLSSARRPWQPLSQVIHHVAECGSGFPTAA